MKKPASLRFAFLLCLLGIVLPALMLQGALTPNFLTCLLAYGASISGSFLGFLAIHSRLASPFRQSPSALAKLNTPTRWPLSDRPHVPAARTM